MRLLALFSAFLLPLACLSQSRLNYTLKKELDSILFTDQKYRELLYKKEIPGKADSIARAYNIPVSSLDAFLWKKIHYYDSVNIARVEQIVREVGYPGKSMVGEPANTAVFYVIQHSSKIDKYLHLIQEAAEKGELPFADYAKMLDRSLMNAGKAQIYGTQIFGFSTTDSTGTRVNKMFVWPIADAAKVNEKRKEAGLEGTVEELARGFHFDYRVYTLDEVKKMLPKDVSTRIFSGN